MDNSVSRLLAILEAGKAYKPSTPCVTVWRSILKVESDVEVPERYGQVLNLAGKAAQDILRVSPSAADGVNHWRSRILSAMSTSNMSSPWEHFFTHIDTHTFAYLRIQADLLDGKLPTKTLDKDLLAKSRQYLQIALKDIRDSDLSPNIRITLIARIQAIISAIDNYAVSGQEEVFDSLKSAVFDIAAITKKEGDFAGKSKVYDGLSILADLMSFADGLISLSGPVSQLLKSLP